MYVFRGLEVTLTLVYANTYNKKQNVVVISYAFVKRKYEIIFKKQNVFFMNIPFM